MEISRGEQIFIYRSEHQGTQHKSYYVDVQSISKRHVKAIDLNNNNIEKIFNTSRFLEILDIKTPGSGEVENNYWENLSFIKKQDEIKIVITDRHDYEWAKDLIQKKGLYMNYDILFSPAYEEVNPDHLARWILEDNLNVRMQMQLHKIIWGEKKGV